MKKLNTRIALIGALSVLIFGTTGCSKDDVGQEEPEKGGTYKITVKLDDVDTNQDFVSISVAGGTIGGKTDVWKVNGEVRTGEGAISLNKNDFSGATKSYVIETTQPIQAFAAGVQIINYGQNLPISLKIEKNKETKVSEEKTLTGDGADFTKQYSL